MFTVGGFGFSGQGQNNGLAFISLKPWSERVGEENSVTAIIQRAMIALSSINKAVVFRSTYPRWLNWVPRQVLIWNCWTTAIWGTKTDPGAKRAVITGSAITESGHRVRPNGTEDTPMFKVNVNAAKAEAMGVALSDINQTISTAFGSSYVNDFLNRGG